MSEREGGGGGELKRGKGRRDETRGEGEKDMKVMYIS